MDNIILIPAIYEGSRDLKDKSKKLTFQTNEITPAQAAELQIMVQSFVYIALKMEPFRKEEEDVISNLKSEYTDHGKSPSQIQRNCLFLLWKNDHEGYMEFNNYYNHHMGKFIEYLKSKMPPDNNG